MSRSVVLCYHALSHTWPAALSTTPARFEAQLRHLLRRGHRGATFGEAVAAGARERLVVPTFDDAFASVIELAFPIMSRLGVPGTVFVPTDYPDQPPPMAWDGTDRWLGGPHEDELRCMSWEELDRLAEAGWEIGSHTRSHPRLTQLDDESLAAELEGSRTACEQRLGRPCRSLAYPYGDWDERVASAAGAAGYESAATLAASAPEGRPLAWPRIGIYNKDATWRWRLKLSPLAARFPGR